VKAFDSAGIQQIAQDPLPLVIGLLPFMVPSSLALFKVFTNIRHASTNRMTALTSRFEAITPPPVAEAKTSDQINIFASDCNISFWDVATRYVEEDVTSNSMACFVYSILPMSCRKMGKTIETDFHLSIDFSLGLSPITFFSHSRVFEVNKSFYLSVTLVFRLNMMNGHTTLS